MSKFWRFLIWTVIVLGAAVGALRLLLFESWTIPEDDPWLGASVAPTLGPGDSVLLLMRGTPGFGDLVRCTDPDNPAGWVVGRIVGVEGDLVEVQGPSLSVNGTRYDSTEVCKETEFTVAHPDTGADVVLYCARVEMGGSWHFRGAGTKHSPSDDKRHAVGSGRVFLLSDNRTLHSDSRDFGAVDLASCRGVVVFRLWGRGGWSDSNRRLSVIR